jgi:dolichol-phosphate mannosyltransferase
MQKTISIVIPVYNEEENIPLIYRAVESVLDQLSKYNHEIVFINDGSTDHSGEVIKEIIKNNHQAGIVYLEFSRNFGKEMAITAGLNHCTGDSAIIIDADLQHPVGMIPRFISEWENGFEVVIGVRKKSKSDTLVKTLGSKLFYLIISRISETEITPNSTDFRLLDRKVIDVFNQCTERTRITRGLISWLGFKKTFVEFEANARVNGEAGYSTTKLIKLALSSFVSMSLFPLKVAGYLGIFITLCSGLFGVFILVDKFVFGNHFGFTWLAGMIVMNIFLIGIILSCLGLIALYVGAISQEVSGRPLYVVREMKR